MRVWTNGVRHLVLDGHGLSVFTAGGRQQIPATPLTSGFDRAPLAVSPDGRHVWARAHAALSLFRLEPWAPRITSAYAAHFLDDERAIAIVDRAGERMVAVRAMTSIVKNEFPPEWDSFAEYFPLAAPKKVEWPSAEGRVWSTPTFSTSRSLSASWEWIANEYGVAGVDNERGIVVGWIAGDAKPTFVLRVPVEFPETEIYAALTRDGVIVAHGGGRSSGAINAFARDGKHLGAMVIEGPASPIVVRGDECFIATERTDFTSRVDVRRIAIDAMRTVETIETTLLATNGYPALAVAADARTIVVGDGAEAWLLRRRDEGSYDRERLDTAPSVTRAEAPEPAPATDSSRGPTRVEHKSFGVGTVLATMGDGESLKYEIEFESAGRKTLMARFVQIVE